MYLENLYIKNNTMKKIIALLIIFVMTFTSGYAITDKTVNLTTYDLLKTNIFYINWQGYTKVDWKLKKVEWIKFYSINWKRYIKENWKIKQVKENKIKQINWRNYILDKNTKRLITLDKYLLENPVKETKKTFSDIFKLEKKKDLKLDYLYEYKLNNFQKKALNNIVKTIEEKYPKNLSSLKLLKEWKFNTEEIEKIRNYYFNLGEIELSKNLNVLKNISQINVKEVNYAIKKKLNNEKINFVQNNNLNTDINKDVDTSLSSIMKDFWLDDEENVDLNSTEEKTIKKTEEVVNPINQPTETVKDNTSNTGSTIDTTNDKNMEEIMNIFNWL